MNLYLRDLFSKNYIEEEEKQEALCDENEFRIMDVPIGENDNELMEWLDEEDEYHNDNEDVSTYIRARGLNE